MREAALIDAHVLLGLVAGSGPPSEARDLLADPSVPLLVTSVPAFESSLRFRLGTLVMAGPTIRRWGLA